MEEIEQKFSDSPTMSMRKMVRDMDMSHLMMVEAVKDLGMVSRVRPLRHLLTQQQKEKSQHGRVAERYTSMLTWLKHHGATVKIFSEKTMFTVDQFFNHRNDRRVGPVGAEAVPVPVQCTKHLGVSWFLLLLPVMGRRCHPTSLTSVSWSTPTCT